MSNVELSPSRILALPEAYATACLRCAASDDECSICPNCGTPYTND